MTHPHNETPVNPLPPVVAALFLVMAGIELTFSLAEEGLIGGAGAVGWRSAMWEQYGFSGRVLDWMWQTGQYPADQMMRFVTYPFVQGSFGQALFALVFLLALGKMVGEALGSLRLFVIYIVSAAFGALAYGVFLDDPRILVGGMPPAYGLIGAYTYLLWLGLGLHGGSQIQAFRLIGILLLVQLVFGVLFGLDNSWVAKVAGFVAGFVTTLLLVPGGVARLLHMLRRD